MGLEKQEYHNGFGEVDFKKTSYAVLPGLPDPATNCIKPISDYEEISYEKIDKCTYAETSSFSLFDITTTTYDTTI